MQLKSLWIKASAKCANANVRVVDGCCAAAMMFSVVSMALLCGFQGVYMRLLLCYRQFFTGQGQTAHLHTA